MAPSAVAGQRGKQQWLHGVSSPPATTADIDTPFPPFRVEFSGKCEEERGQKNTNEKTALFGFSCNLACTYANLLQMGSLSFC